MLFVLGIYLLSGRARSVLWQVSAFTVAHSITLGLSMYGVVAVSPRIVEPLIALSIAYVAIENIFLSELKSWRVALVFAFGLLHGMGFAGALKELGLPRSEFVTALLTFNVGVEAGQLAVIGAAFLLVGWHCANRAWYRSRIVVPASALIACTAVYWTIERLYSLEHLAKLASASRSAGLKACKWPPGSPEGLRYAQFRNALLERLLPSGAFQERRIRGHEQPISDVMQGAVGGDRNRVARAGPSLVRLPRQPRRRRRRGLHRVRRMASPTCRACGRTPRLLPLSVRVRSRGRRS